jgi:hypothetical protein
MRFYFGINNVSGVYLVQVSMILFWSAGFGTFLLVSAHLLPIGWPTVPIVRQHQRKMTILYNANHS